MLLKTSEQKQTISRVHQNVADWHYGKAAEAWDEYNHCLSEGVFYDDEKKHPVPGGLYHPDFIPVVKKSLSDFYRHTAIADRLMRIRQ